MIDPAITARARAIKERGLPVEGTIVAMVVPKRADLPEGVVVLGMIEENRTHRGETTSTMRLIDGTEEDLAIAQCSNRTCFFRLTEKNDWEAIRRRGRIIL